MVDAYYGPQELARQVESESLTPAHDLVDDAAALRAEVSGLDDAQRAKFLAAQLDGVSATAERLAGRPITYKEEVRRCYGIDIEQIGEEGFAEALEELDRLIPGTGPLRERYGAWRRTTEVPTGALLEALPDVKAELQLRTAELFGLPDGESADLELTSNQPWLAFNYYLGGLKSRIAINTDIPTRSEAVAGLVAHEIYPGHHTEHSWKEELLARRRGRLEESIFLIGTPQCLVSEGIASYALEALGPEAENACAALLAQRGHGYDLELSRKVREVTHRLAAAHDNVAIMLYEQGVDREDAMRYLCAWTVETEDRLEKNLDFLLHPVWRAYYAVYEAGYRAVAAWTGGQADRFRRLLTEQLTPADLFSRDRYTASSSPSQS